MKRVLVAVGAAIAILAVGIAPATAITKNYYPDPDHPYVGLVAFYDEAGEFSHRCTGELLAPTVLLTAGHCTDNEAGGVNASARVWFQQEVGKNYDPATQLDPTTGYPEYCASGTQGKLCATSDEMYNYGFDNFAGFPDTHDVGIVILDQAIKMPRYAYLAGAGELGPLDTAKGTQDKEFRVSGYGISFSSPQGSISYRVRLQAVSKLVNTVSANNDGYNIQLNGNGDDRGGTCSGDSGGPVFYPEGSDQVVAVTSWGMGNAGCRGDGWYYRTDRQAVIDWILQKAGAAASRIRVD